MDVLRFSDFEVDLRAGELRRRDGTKIKLQQQPFRVLVLLLQRAGDVVTREELRQAIWPAGTFVEFNLGLDTAIYRLRTALGDSAETPQFLETLPRRGYRFIAPVDRVVPAPPQRPRIARQLLYAFGALAVLTVGYGLLARRAATPGIHSIAVLPLENLSGDSAQEYFAEGMTEALVTRLGKTGGLRVISHTSARHYKGTRETLPEIARRLHVDAVIEGAVLRVGNRVRVTAQLIEASTDRHLWAETYESDLRDVLGLQDAIARAITNEVQIRLSSSQPSPVASTRARPVDPDAYDLYLPGSCRVERVD